ncbi:chaperonin 10-like protein [Aspergillus carlsbadensis]|nr:chaperonin 10-like protein [Aspergillus carlsbadensis]
MRAARFHAAKDIRVEEIPAPEPGDCDDKVLVEVEWCGICGSDLGEYLSGPYTIPSPKTGPHPLTNCTLPVTIGHEFTGRIKHVPASLEHLQQTSGNNIPLRKGQAVVVDPRFFCTSCNACARSATNCCDKIGFLGLSGGGGGLAEVVAVQPGQVYVLGSGSTDLVRGRGRDENGGVVDLAAAALIEPLAVAWHGFRLFLSTQSGFDVAATTALIIGAGPVGVAISFVLRAWGVTHVFVSEPSKARRETLQNMKVVSEIFDPVADNLRERCRTATPDGLGVGVVFDCAGSQAGFQAGCESLRFRGVYVNLAVPRTPVTIPLGPFMQKELTYKSSLAYDQGDFWETVDAFMEGRFAGVERMITGRIALADIVEKGFEELVRPNDHLKILASPKSIAHSI